jgi:hypothetical protein
MITRIFLAPRRRDMSSEACLAHWRGEHAAIGARLPGVRAYVQNHGVLEDGASCLAILGRHHAGARLGRRAAVDRAIDFGARAGLGR